MQQAEKKPVKPIPNSPEELSDYIVVAHPRVWIFLCVIVALLLSFLAWCIWGTISKTITCSGLFIDGNVIVCLSEEQKAAFSDADEIYLHTRGQYYSGTLKYIENYPHSADELEKRFDGDSYIIYILNKDNRVWLYYCEITPEGQLEEGPVDVTVRTKPIHPISFVIQ